MKRILLAFIGITCSFQWLLAQDGDQLLLVRKDVVMPSMVDEYERTIRDIKGYLDSNKDSGFKFFSHLMDDYTFSHITPIANLSEIENGIQSYYAGKVNDPAFYLLQDNMYETVESYVYYLIKYHSELSYIPTNDDWSEGKQYRKWMYYKFMPDTQEEVKEVLKAWKRLYESKNIQMGFRVFSGMIGIEQPTFIFATWAESPSMYQEQLENVSAELGEEGSALWDNMQQFILEVEVVEGWYLPQYSYNEGAELAK